MKKTLMCTTILAAMLALAGCGGGSDDSGSKPKPNNPNENPTPTTPEPSVKLTTVDTQSIEYEYIGDETYKDKTPSTSFFVTEDNKLGIRVNGMELEEGKGVEKLEVSNVTITEATARAIAESRTTDDTRCTEVETGKGGAADKFDIVISLDTTGSMGSHAERSANKIAAFAEELQTRGLDVKFAGITTGDAFATLNTSDGFSNAVVKGSLGTPPDFDSNSRPDTGLTLVSAEHMKDFFTEISTYVRSGQGGGDLPENYLAPLDYFNKKLNFREGAGRLFIAVGDDCAHTAETFKYKNGGDVWKPRDATAIEADFVKSGASVNLMWSSRSCYGDYYDMQNLRKATGGATTTLSGELTDLPLINAVSSKRSTLACGVPEKAKTIHVKFNIGGGTKRSDGTYPASWTVEATLNVNGTTGTGTGTGTGATGSYNEFVSFTGGIGGVVNNSTHDTKIAESCTVTRSGNALTISVASLGSGTVAASKLESMTTDSPKAQHLHFDLGSSTSYALMQNIEYEGKLIRSAQLISGGKTYTCQTY